MNPNMDERADAYLHGLLTPAEAREFERDLAKDLALRSALETARRRLALLQSALPPAESSEALVRATLKRVVEEPKQRWRMRRRTYALMFAPLAASALVLAILQVHYQRLSANPINLEVYGQNALTPGSPAALRIRLTDKLNQMPLAGVPVEVTLGDPGAANFVTLANFTTDERGNGQPAFRLPDWADGSYTMHITARTPQPEVLTETVRLKRSAKLLLTSDKPVYQPGQTIHLRSLTLQRPDLKPAADAESQFTIADPRGNTIFRSAQRTSKFGIAAVDCPLADELIEGTYKIQCQVGDTASALAVDVHKYVLPKIRLTLTTEQAWYQPGQEVRGKLRATYQHGEPVAEADWELEASTNLPGLPVLAKLAGNTDGHGESEITFRLPAKLGGAVNLAARVRDRAGQEQALQSYRPIDSQPFRFDVIPENGLLVAGVPNQLYVYTHTIDGAPAKVKGKLVIGSTEYPVGTNDLGVGVVTYTPPEGPPVEPRVAFVNETGKSSPEPLGPSLRIVERATGEFILRTDKAVYTAGETMHLNVHGGSGPVFLDMLKDDQTVRSDVIDVKDGRGELAFDIPAELFGTLQLCAYRFDANGRPLRKTRALFIRPASELRIALKPDKPEHRPGERGKLDFTLTDRQGRPVPGALSLAMVDEAVFDVRQQLPGLERTFYLLEQKLLQPAASIYPWTPDVELRAAPADRELFEQAVFARTAQTVYPAEASDGKTPYSIYAPSPPFLLHSLNDETYRQKEEEIGRKRRDSLHVVNLLWTVLVISFVAMLDLILWTLLPRRFALELHLAGAILVLLAGLTWMGGLGIRESSRGARLYQAPAESSAEPSKAAAASAGGFGPSAGPMGPSLGSAQAPPRVRERFPETMLWQPQLITDDNGHASLDLDLADSITTWRLSASAVSAEGALGSLQEGLRVFQPFFVDLNLPVTLAREDEIDVPAVVSNFAKTSQTVELTLEKADWFNRLGADALKLDLKPGEVRSAAFRIRVRKVGRHELRVTAKSAEFADAVVRTIEVLPNGRRVEQITNGLLTQPASVKLDLPAEAIEGSGKAILRIYPSSFSQLVDGLEGIFRLPTGCFEQTSSSLYPNVMALTYLRQMDKHNPEVEAKALGYIHSGYQRLLTFEVPGGGFDWYGRAPANVTLTAYGLMEFRDMARVHDVDPKLIERTRSWLLSRRQLDGSWGDDQRHAFRELDTGGLRATAYVAWAVFDGQPGPEAAATRDFILKHPSQAIRNPYVLALVCNALLAMDLKDPAVGPYLDRLLALKQTAAGDGKTWWPAGGEPTTFYATGRFADVETTALAVLALLRAEREPAAVRSALAWIATQRQVGHWGSTQATILALKALVAGSGKPDPGPRQIAVALDGKLVKTIDIPPDQAEVMHQLDLSDRLKPGGQELTLRDRRGNGPGFQVEFRYHVPGENPSEPAGPLAIDLKYDRDTLTIADTLNVTATATNKTAQVAPMVMLDLPIPPGFRVDTEDFDTLVSKGIIARYQVTPRQIIVYLRGLEARQSLPLKYRLRPGDPAVLSVPPARVWEYYNPDREARGGAAKVTVTARK